VQFFLKKRRMGVQEREREKAEEGEGREAEP
jgi:hypothetical protein